MNSPTAAALYLLRWHLRVLRRSLGRPVVLFSLGMWFLLQAMLMGSSIFLSARSGLTTILSGLETMMFLGTLSALLARHLQQLFGNALGFLSLAPLPPAAISLFSTLSLAGEACTAATLLVAPVAVVLTLRFHGLWALPAGAVLAGFAAALLMLGPVAVNLLALRLLPSRQRQWAGLLTLAPFTFGVFLMPVVRMPVRILIEAAQGQTGLLIRWILPLLLATVLMLLLAVGLSLSPLSRSLLHLRTSHSPDARTPSQRVPTGSGRLHFWLLALSSKRQKTLLALSFIGLVNYLILRFQPASGQAHMFYLFYSIAISSLGLGIFMPERFSFALPYLWPMPLERFWRDRTLWLLAEGLLLTGVYGALLVLTGARLPVPSLLLAVSFAPAALVWGSYLAVRMRLHARKGMRTGGQTVAPLFVMGVTEGAIFLEMALRSFWPLLLAANGALLVTPFLVVPRLLAKPGPHRYPL